MLCHMLQNTRVAEMSKKKGIAFILLSISSNI